MKLIANENFPLLAVEGLRQAGHDIVWVRTEMRAATDQQVLERAQADERLVITFDKDFGELAFRWGLSATCGVILFRLRLQSPEYVKTLVVETLAPRPDWSGHFFVVDEHRIRSRPLRTPKPR